MVFATVLECKQASVALASASRGFHLMPTQPITAAFKVARMQNCRSKHKMRADKFFL